MSGCVILSVFPDDLEELLHQLDEDLIDVKYIKLTFCEKLDMMRGCKAVKYSMSFNLAFNAAFVDAH